MLVFGYLLFPVRMYNNMWVNTYNINNDDNDDSHSYC